MTDFGQCCRVVACAPADRSRPHRRGWMHEGRKCRRRATVLLEQQRSRPLPMCTQHSRAVYAMGLP